MEITESLTDWKSKVPSVSQLTRRIRGHIENTFFDLWVKGEISNFKKPSSGHCYFNLKDANAQLRAVMFRSSLSKVKFELKDGMEILLHGNFTVYEARGEYQLVADNAEPLGTGALQLAFEQLKKKLQAEGLFSPEYKKKIPVLPKRIAVITSPTGAVIRDILNVLDRRFREREILVIPTSVQGEKASKEIASAIQTALEWNQKNRSREIEVIILARGGGSLEDLWSFNEEIVARAIFDCPIPIISAVGHETDVTIADFVADLRAPTPSAAAELVVPRKQDLIDLVSQHQTRLNHSIKRYLVQLRLHLDHLSNRLVNPREKIQHLREKFQNLQNQMYSIFQNRLKIVRKQLESNAQMLHSLSPLQVLARGYSLTRTAEKKIIQSVKEVSQGEIIVTQLQDGELYSEILPKP